MKNHFKKIKNIVPDLSNISFSARFALWIGVAFIIFGYLYNKSNFMLIGVVLTIVGIGIWGYFKDNKFSNFKKFFKKIKKYRGRFINFSVFKNKNKQKNK